MNQKYLRSLTDEEISHLINSRLRVERVKASAYLTRMGHNYHKELLRLQHKSTSLNFNLDTYTVCSKGLEITRCKT
jgi:hypothetical protein